MTRNVTVSLANPDVEVENKDIWLRLNTQAPGNPAFTAVEIKAFYIVGLISDICQSVEWLLRAPDAWPNKYLPAFVLFASGVDLLGRCLTGNDEDYLNQNLKVGFHYLAKPDPRPPATKISATDEAVEVVRTAAHSYTVIELVNLRHYSTHGQATVAGQLPGLHCELLDKFPKLIGNAMEIYWKGLQTDTEYCNRIARAKFKLYIERVEPLRQTQEYFSVRENSIRSLFDRLNWQVENCG